MRKVRILNTKTGEWEVKDFKDIKADNIFMVIERSGKAVKKDDYTVFQAMTDAYQTEKVEDFLFSHEDGYEVEYSYLYQ